MKAVLWDLDGTLVDSADYHWQAWLRTMTDEGLEVSHRQFLETFGQRNDTILPLWLGEDATPERMEQIGLAKEICYRRLVREGALEALPGAADWVRCLNERGWLQAVASSAPRLNIEVVLGALGLTGLFQATTSAEDVENGKPAPDVFLMAASRLGASPDECIVVEDAVAGVEAARRAGMRVIGVGGNGDLAAADLTTPTLAELPGDTFDALLR